MGIFSIIISIVDKMVRIDNLLELLRTLIISNVEITVKVNKDTLIDIQNSLQNVQEQIEFLQLESQF